MPFYCDYSDENASILSWKYHEDDHFDLEELIEPENLERVMGFHPKKMKEYLMVRKMLKMALPNHQIMYKTIGEPYLWPNTAYISITHSFPFASLAISNKRIGVDLEKIQEKIVRVKPRFLHPSEYSWTEGSSNEIELLTIIWVIKESLYKLHPSKFWSLKDHYEVFPFEGNDLSKIACRVFDEGFSHDFTAKVIQIESFYFSIVEEK